MHINMPDNFDDLSIDEKISLYCDKIPDKINPERFSYTVKDGLIRRENIFKRGDNWIGRNGRKITTDTE